jgi:tRNA-splicing ligase RtcB
MLMQEGVPFLKSLGLGYQVCDDSLRALRDAPTKYGMELPDQQLVCAPVESRRWRYHRR